MSERPQVFVIGCPRSGTSPFAQWLHACGLTTVTDARRHDRYPKGYLEHLPVSIFHRGLERLPRGSDHAIRTEPFLKSELLDDPFIEATFQLAFRPMLKGEIEFLKYPQLALSIDFVLEHFPDTHLIALWRDPLASFRSLVTREFPPEMFASSGLRSTLLWNLYAHHIVRGRREHPEAVSVLNVDDFFADPAAGPKLLERIGRPGSQAVPVGDAIDLALWSRPVSPAWRLYHRATVAVCGLLRKPLGNERAALADQAFWERELRSVTDS